MMSLDPVPKPYRIGLPLLSGRTPTLFRQTRHPASLSAIIIALDMLLSAVAIMWHPLRVGDRVAASSELQMFLLIDYQPPYLAELNIHSAF
jgi:hypothetical protein